MGKPKILILSVFPADINENNTFEFLFRGMENYFDFTFLSCRNANGNSLTFKNVYRLNEKKVFYSILKRSIDVFEPWAPVSNECPAKIYTRRIFLRNLMRLLRDFFWKLSSWKNSSLNQFLSNNHFDYILASSEGFLYYLDVLTYCLSKSDSKLVLFTWDDNFTYKQKQFSPLFYIYRFLLRIRFKKIRSLIYKSLAISEKTKKECDLFFHTNSVVIQKTLPEKFTQRKKRTPPLVIVYGGNLQYGRERQLITFAKCLQEDCFSDFFILDVYPTKFDDRLFRKLSHFKNVRLHHPVSHDDLLLAEQKGDVCLLLESLRINKAYIARLSMSTKLVDYLSVGNPVFCISKKDNATAEYINNKKLGFVCPTKSSILTALLAIKNDSASLQEIGEHVAKTFAEDHSRATNVKLLCSIFK